MMGARLKVLAVFADGDFSRSWSWAVANRPIDNARGLFWRFGEGVVSKAGVPAIVATIKHERPDVLVLTLSDHHPAKSIIALGALMVDEQPRRVRTVDYARVVEHAGVRVHLMPQAAHRLAQRRLRAIDRKMFTRRISPRQAFAIWMADHSFRFYDEHPANL